MSAGGRGRAGLAASSSLDIPGELRALCAAGCNLTAERREPGPIAPLGPPWQLACGEGHGGNPALLIECAWVEEVADVPRLEAARVQMGPWEWRYTWRDAEEAEEAEEAEDAEDRAREFLDLVGAAVFGDVVVEERFTSGASAWVMKVRDGTGHWRRCGRGSVGWWGFALRLLGASWPGATTRTWMVDRARPEGPEARWRRVEASLPWAPWAGAAGFVGRGAHVAPRQIPMDGELDLHQFAPKDVKRLLHAYIDECLTRGITELRVVHGKGKGHMRRTVHSILDKHSAVASYRLAGQGRGGWGATLVELTPTSN